MRYPYRNTDTFRTCQFTDRDQQEALKAQGTTHEADDLITRALLGSATRQGATQQGNEQTRSRHVTQTHSYHKEACAAPRASAHCSSGRGTQTRFPGGLLPLLAPRAWHALQGLLQLTQSALKRQSVSGRHGNVTCTPETQPCSENQYRACLLRH